MRNSIKALIAVTGIVAMSAMLATSVNVHGNNINADTGYQVAGAAPSNHVLLGNGTQYVDSATVPYSILSGAGTPITCNGNGCYRITADGTIEEWGHVTVGGSVAADVGATFPYSTGFTTVSSIAITFGSEYCTPGAGGGCNGSHPFTCSIDQYSYATTGTAFHIWYDGNGSTVQSGAICNWYAIGK